VDVEVVFDPPGIPRIGMGLRSWAPRGRRVMHGAAAGCAASAHRATWETPVAAAGRLPGRGAQPVAGTAALVAAAPDLAVGWLRRSARRRHLLGLAF
jgi:hypothetical protein